MSEYKNTNDINHLNRLHWACRRGMLELDVLLGKFLKERYSRLSQSDQALFERFLAVEDQVLYEWLLGASKPTDMQLLKMSEMIRQYARS